MATDRSRRGRDSIEKLYSIFHRSSADSIVFRYCFSAHAHCSASEQNNIFGLYARGAFKLVSLGYLFCFVCCTDFVWCTVSRGSLATPEMTCMRYIQLAKERNRVSITSTWYSIDFHVIWSHHQPIGSGDTTIVKRVISRSNANMEENKKPQKEGKRISHRIPFRFSRSRSEVIESKIVGNQMIVVKTTIIFSASSSCITDTHTHIRHTAQNVRTFIRGQKRVHFRLMPSQLDSDCRCRRSTRRRNEDSCILFTVIACLTADESTASTFLFSSPPLPK